MSSSLSTRSTQIARLSGHALQNLPGTKKIVLAALAEILLEENLDRILLPRSKEGFEAFRNDPLGNLNLARRRVGLRPFAPDAPGCRPPAGFGPAGCRRLFDRDFRFEPGYRGPDFQPVPGRRKSRPGGMRDPSRDRGLQPGRGERLRRRSRIFLPGGVSASGRIRGRARPQKLWGTGLELRGRPFGRRPPGRRFVQAQGACCLRPRPRDQPSGRQDQDPWNSSFTWALSPIRSSGLAHAVLPTTTYVEADGTTTNTERRIQLNRRKTEPRFEARPAWRIFADLAARRGPPWPYPVFGRHPGRNHQGRPRLRRSDRISDSRSPLRRSPMAQPIRGRFPGPLRFVAPGRRAAAAVPAE